MSTAKQTFKYLNKAPGMYIALLLFSLASYVQVQTLEYNVSYKGKNVGVIQLYQNKTGGDVYTKTVANVKMNLILNINMNTEEESFFQSGKLIYSDASRKVNGKEKVNKQTKAVAGDRL